MSTQHPKHTYHCRRHGEIPEADLYVHVKDGVENRYCRICARERSRTSYRKQHPEKPRRAVPEGFVKVCKHHGPLSAADVVVRQTGKTAGWTECRLCKLRWGGRKAAPPRPARPEGTVYHCRKHGHLTPEQVRVSGAKKKCKECQRERRKRSPRHKERNAEKLAKLRSGEPRYRYYARKMVHAAVEGGLLTRPGACEECGTACAPEAAHVDYATPLVVRWLCRPCHSAFDQTRDRARLVAA